MTILGSILAGLHVRQVSAAPDIPIPDIPGLGDLGFNPEKWAKGIMQAGAEWVIDQLNSSAEQRMQDTIDALMGIKWPDFDESWFEYMIGNTFGLVYVLLALTIMMMGFVGMMFHRWIPQAGRAFGITLFLFVANMGMYMLVVTMDKISQSLTAWAYDIASGGGENPDWSENVSIIEKTADIFGVLFAGWMSFFLGWALKLEAYALQYIPYVALITLVIGFVTWAWTRGSSAGKLIRFTVALLTTSLLGKPIMMALLGIGSLVMRELPADPVWALLFYLIAALAPLVIFWLSNKAYSSILDGMLNVEVNNDIRIDDMPSPEPDELQKHLDGDLDATLNLLDGELPSSGGGAGGLPLADMVGSLVSKDSNSTSDLVVMAAKAAAVAEGQVWAVPLIDAVAEKQQAEKEDDSTPVPMTARQEMEE